MLFGADVVLGWMYSERVTCIEGAQGGGKTSLAYALAIDMIKNQDRGFRYLISNVASDFNDNIEDVVPRDGKHLDCVIIFDEIGKFLNKNNSPLANNLIADLRKINCILILPSRNETQKDLRHFVIEPSANLRSLGIPAIIYKAWLDRRSSHSKSEFAFIGDNGVYGRYDSNEVVEDSQGIIPWLLKTKEEIAKSDYTLKQNKRVFMS